MPPTPAPTATSTATPEPIYYVVQAGENLNIIANKFGVSHDLLRDVNGVVDERALQIGQELIIPLGGVTGPIEPTPTATPTPMPASVENVYFHPSPLGELTVMGDVRNASPVALERVEVQISLFDELDRPLSSQAAYTLLDVLAPGQRAPFAVRFAEAPIRFASYQPTILSAAPAYVGSLHRNLHAANVTAHQQPGDPLVLNGRILNDGDDAAVDVAIVVTAYDALGRVIGARSVAPEAEVLTQGGEIPFHAEIVPAGSVMTYTLQIQGRLAP